MTSASVSPAIITISTTPLGAAQSSGPSRSLDRCPVDHSPLVGRVARVIAGITGVLIGLAIGLVSAGIETTGILLALGAIAFCVGSIIAFVTERTDVTAIRR